MQSPLLRLPPEFRNIIYGYVHCGQNFFVDEVDKFEWQFNREVKMTESLDRALGLPLASRQLKQETALLPYKLATFYFDICHEDTFDKYGRLIKNVHYQQQCEMLRSFLKKRSLEQIKVLSRVGFQAYNKVKRKHEMIMGSGAYWAKERGCGWILISRRSRS